MTQEILHTEPERIQSVPEEVWNSVSHGVGLIASIVGMPFLLIHADQVGGARRVVGAAIFSAATILLYLASTLYHALSRSRMKYAFQVIEHGAIFVLIAGTYTPFTLGVLHGAWGWSLFGVVWAVALSGIILKVLVGGERFPALSMMLYLMMGWIAIVAIRPLWMRMPLPGLFWIALGGASYTAGVPFFNATRMRFAHLIWHHFVLAGTLFHYWAVYQYAG